MHHPYLVADLHPRHESKRHQAESQIPPLAKHIWTEKKGSWFEIYNFLHGSFHPDQIAQTPCAIGSSLPLSNQGPGIPLPALVPHILLNRLPDPFNYLPVPPSACLSRPRTPLINLRAQHPPPPPLNRLR
jgi:hypothetical protein